jgi:putative transposase
VPYRAARAARSSHRISPFRDRWSSSAAALRASCRSVGRRSEIVDMTRMIPKRCRLGGTLCVVSRYRLYPSPAQEILLLEVCGHARYVWNLGLEQRLMWRRWKGPTPNLAVQSRQLTEVRAAFPWLSEGSVTVQQQALRDLDQAWRNFFAGTHDKPTWRKRGQHEGFRIVGRHALLVRQDNAKWSSVRIPKVGWVWFKRSRNLPEWKSYRVTRDRSGRWHVAFAAIPDPIPAPGTGEIVGVDRGVKAAVALSTGELTSPEGLRPKEAERLLRLQRRLARAQRGSVRRGKVKQAIARVKAREVDRRKDWAEKTSTSLARRFDLIRFEDLKVAQMTRSARGTVANPGRNVRQKAGLNRGILAAGWSMLRTRTGQKAPGRVEDVSAAYSSQRCNACGHVDPKSRQSQALFECTNCGHRENADVNAAMNVADGNPGAGRALAARGDRVHPARSMKREPQRTPPSKVA